eukprot:185802-Pleurochrysis_carterae.AAC.2
MDVKARAAARLLHNTLHAGLNRYYVKGWATLASQPAMYGVILLLPRMRQPDKRAQCVKVSSARAAANNC